MAVEITYRSQLSSVVTVESEFVGEDDSFVINGLDSQGVYNGSTTPPVTKVAAFSLAMTAGAGTIDLTNLPGHEDGDAIDGTGLKVQFAKFVNPDTNANAITLQQGASDDYELLGDFTFTLQPGQEVTIKLDDAAPDVASGDKNIDISGTGTQALQVQFNLG